jgi:hypothetical protein
VLPVRDTPSKPPLPTAEALFQKFGGEDWWSPDHSVMVVKTFTRARRCRDALRFLAHPSHVESNLSSQNILVEGLRACAHGGQSEHAERLYNALRSLNTSSMTMDQSSIAKAFFLRAMTKQLGARPSTRRPSEPLELHQNTQHTQE